MRMVSIVKEWASGVNQAVGFKEMRWLARVSDGDSN